MANKINEINISRVLQKLWFSKGISRTDISRQLGLGKSTVTKIMSMLLGRQLVKITSGGRSGPTGGRRPLNLMINKDYGYILGLEIQTESFTAVAINLLGEIIFSRCEPIAFNEKDIVSTFREVLQLLEPGLREIDMPLIGIGVGVAGIIDPYAGVIIQSNPLNITEEVRFYDEASGLVAPPVLIENDANCCCWGELAFKKTQRHENFVFVLGELRRGRTTSSDYWGIAVGLGFVLNGKVYNGKNFSSGEFQSILWEPENNGQFSIADADSRKIKTDKEVLVRVLRELSSHVAFLVNILNLSCVVIGGAISAYKDLLVDILQEEIQKNWSYPNKVDCALEFATMGDMAVAYGAAGMFLERFFSVPDVVDTPEGGTSKKIRALYMYRPNLKNRRSIFKPAALARSLSARA